jgi:quercetin dioxygenase-like cupin family protein
MRRSRWVRSLALATLALAIPFGVVVATMGSGVVGAIVGRGTIDARVHGEFSGFDLIVRKDTDAVTQSLTIAPGGHTGWHTHPGVAVVTILSGTLTFITAHDEECMGHEYTVGDTFVDTGRQTHIARNLGSVPVTLSVTYFIPVGADIRTDQPDPGTGC